MSSELQRLTTEYIPGEDRIRLAGELAPEQPVVVWLTQRLLYRLLPALLQWLDEQVEKSPIVASQPVSANPAGRDGIKDFLQESAQNSAQQAVTPQAPVRAGTDSPSWVAHAVDMTLLPQAMRLTVRGEGVQLNDAAAERMLHWSMNPQALRQWLGILQRVTLKAEWPQDIWPAWMQTKPAPAILSKAALH